AERSEGTLDAAEHRGLLVGRWTPRSVGVAGIELKEIRSNRPRSGPPQSQKSRADGSDRMSTMFFHTCPRNRIKIMYLRAFFVVSCLRGKKYSNHKGC